MNRYPKITFYRSAICPRCRLVAGELKKIQKKYNLEIIEVELTTNPLTTWKAGIRMIPALECKGEVLSGIYLSPVKIRSFIEKTVCV